MKSKRATFLMTGLLIIALLLAACSQKSQQTESATQPDASSNAVDNRQASTAENSGGPCDNIFYPMTKDNQWVYDYQVQDPEGNTEQSSIALTVSESSDSTAVLAALSYDTGLVTESDVQCNDQAIQNFPITELKMVLGKLAGDINLEYQSGTFMPSEQKFLDNNWSLEWQTNYTATGSIKASYEGEELSAVLDNSPVHMNWKVVGTGESKDVPAGNFSGLVKMEREIAFDITNLQTNIQGNDVNISTTLTMITELWYAPHIGLIEQDVKGMSIKLYGINFPVEAIGTVKLSSYTVN